LTILNFDLKISQHLVNLTAENRPDRIDFLKASEDVFEWEQPVGKSLFMTTPNLKALPFL